jgi:hypothetical protein
MCGYGPLVRKTVVTAVGENKQQIMRWAMAMDEPFVEYERDFGAKRVDHRQVQPASKRRGDRLRGWAYRTEIEPEPGAGPVCPICCPSSAPRRATRRSAVRPATAGTVASGAKIKPGEPRRGAPPQSIPLPRRSARCRHMDDALEQRCGGDRRLWRSGGVVLPSASG